MITKGSSALNSYFSLDRKVKDFDAFVFQEEYDKFILDNKEYIVLINDGKYGYTIYMEGSIPLEFEIIEKRPSNLLLVKLLDAKPFEDFVLPLKYLYLLKMSHRYLKNSKHFLKTMKDIHTMRRLGCIIPKDDKEVMEWFKLREKETYDYSHPKLNTSKDGFFRDNFYVYEHDDIHRVVAINENPAFEYIKDDKAEVFCSKKKFLFQTEELQLTTVYEEAAVLALERMLIPGDFKQSHERAFLISLEKICTSIASGWWREFAWENYEKVVDFWTKQGKDGYVIKFKKALEENKIKKL